MRIGLVFVLIVVVCGCVTTRDRYNPANRSESDARNWASSHSHSHSHGDGHTHEHHNHGQHSHGDHSHRDHSHAASQPESSIDEAWLRDFEATARRAGQLLEYGRAATSLNRYLIEQSIATPTGSLALCFPGEDTWWGVVGVYDPAARGFRNSSWFRISEQVEPVSVAAAPAFPWPLGSALQRASQELRAVLAVHRQPMNSYVVSEPGGPIEVWFLPAIRADATLLHRGASHYVFDATGRDLLRREERKKGLRSFRPDGASNIVLESESEPGPTVEDLFFVLSHHGSFRTITIRTSHHETQLASTPSGSWVWRHRGR